jgi:CHAT domain-containing protein
MTSMEKKVLLVTFMLLAASVMVNGQIWRDKYNQAASLYSMEKYEEAQALANESLISYLAEGAPSGDTHAAILRLLSTISYIRQDFAKGLEYSTKEIQLREGKKDTVLAIALVNRALFQEQLGQFDQALVSLTEARTLFLTAYPENHTTVLECAIGIGTIYYLNNDLTKARDWIYPALTEAEKNGEYTAEILEGYYYAGMIDLESSEVGDALARFTKAEEFYKSASLEQSTDYALVLYGKGLAQQRLRQYAEADATLLSAQKTYEQVAGKEGEEYYVMVSARVLNAHNWNKPSLATEWINGLKSNASARSSYAEMNVSLGFYYHGQGDLIKAEAYYREALAAFDGRDEARYAETNINLATLLADQGQTEEALKRISASQAVIEKARGRESVLYRRALIRQGVIQVLASQWPAAEKTFDEVSKNLASLPAAEQSMLLNGMGEVAWRNGKYRRADSLYSAVQRPYESEGKTPDRYYAMALNNLAAARQAEGRFSETLSLTKRSATVTRQLFGAGSLAYANALENEALLRMRMGDLVAAKSRLDSAIVIYELVTGKESLPYANCLLTLSRHLQLTGDYTQAEPHIKTARDIIRKTKGEDSPEFAGVQNSLALLYQTLGNYRDAEVALKSAQSIMQRTRGTMDPEYATIIQNLAALYQLEGMYEKAEPLQREALEIDRKALGENHPQYTITLQNLATLYQKVGKKTEAKEILERVLEANVRQLGSRHPSYITTLSNLAATYQDLGDYALAEKTWVQTVNLRKEVLGEDHPDYARSLYGLAGVYHAQGQWAKAKVHYDPVIARYQKQVEEFFPALSEKEKSAFYAKVKPVFEAYQDFSVQYLSAFPAEREATLGKLYDLQLNTKAILLVATNKVRSRILASGNVELQELFRDWLTTKEQIVRYYSASQEERQRSGLNLTQVENHANELEKKLSEQSDAFRSQREKDKLTWKEVRNALADGEAAVEILRVRHKYTKDSVYYIGLILQKGSPAPEMVRWSFGAQLEGKKFKYHRNTIKYHVNDTISYRYYWQPLEERIKEGSTIFLSCDGVFNKVNFNSLYKSNTKRFVIDDYRLHQVSNTRELIGRNAAIKTPMNSAYLFGYADFNLGEADVVSHSTKRNLARSLGFEGESIPVLPATEKEVDEIAKLLTRSSWVTENLKRAQASEENLKKAVNPKLMHIATHGFFLSDVDMSDTESELSQNPLFRSGVLLAGAGVDREESKREEDGVLTAYEAMNLNLDQTELVILSACETGLGEVRNGEGVYGLQRSFLVAGANTVLMSLWQVDDVATQELMNAFFEFWLAGTEKHEAFRKAQLQMKDKYQIPYFWGAFVLIGN